MDMPDSKTGRYKGYIKSGAEAEDLFKQYLAQCDTDEGSLEGFPRDTRGPQGSRGAEKAQSGAKRRLTAYSRVLEHFRSDLDLELRGWRLLCKAFDSFTEGWNEVLSQPRVSERTLKALFNAPFVDRLAWNVTGEEKRIEANQKGNAEKGRVLRERAGDERGAN
ncbi:hypothetical protein DL767_001541 [Monosporascus sp. MG133]|nr:hypothetical protein DL767_001541 [Monosporascus sp. MG133]